MSSFFVNHCLCAFIPVRKWRHRIRSCGKLKRHALEMANRPAPAHFLSVLAIMKNEGPYLQEWIEYHLLIGVEKFHLYDNESADDTKKILAPYIEEDVVDYVYWPGEKQQLPAYADWLAKHKPDTEWLAVIDLDEFIVSYYDRHLPNVLKELPRDVSQLHLGWQSFGSSGHNAKPDGLVMENYVWRDIGSSSVANYHGTADYFKSVVRPSCSLGIHCHAAMMFSGRSGSLICDTDVSQGSRISRNILALNHYCVKSRDEFFKAKSKRGGGVNGKSGWYSDSMLEMQFNIKDTNFIHDTFLKDKFAQDVKLAIDARNQREADEFAWCMTFAERRLFKKHIRQAGKYLEFGCGGSTLAALAYSQARIVSIDSSNDWLDRMTRDYPRIHAGLDGKRLRLHYSNIGPTGKWGYPAGNSRRADWPGYSADCFQKFGTDWDLVLVDGRFRVACALQAALQTNAAIAIHDFWNRPQYHILLDFIKSVDRADSMGIFRKKPDFDRAKAASLYDEYKYIPD